MNVVRRFIKKHIEPIRNWSLVLLMCCLTFVFLSLQGIVQFKPPDFEQLRAAAQRSHDPQVMVLATETALRKNFGINARSLANFVYYAPKSAMDASEILILQVREEAQLEDCARLVEERRRTNAATFRNYRPLQADILERSYLKTQGSFLIFISAENASAIKDTVDAAFRLTE